MQVVVGHANPDFDAYASTVAGLRLFPGSKGVFLGTQNANVRAFHYLHEEFFDFVDLRHLDIASITRLVMVDTRDPERLAELASVARREDVDVIIYDHHPAQDGDLTRGADRSREVGATTSILVHELGEHDIEISPLEASVMLLGIHEDTGSLTYPGTTAYDVEAAAWLMERGAEIEVLNQYLRRELDPGQSAVLDQLTSSLELWEVSGQEVAVGVACSKEYVDSAGVLTHYVVEDMGNRVGFAIVEMPGRLQIVARSRLPEVDVGAVMKLLGGGGHAQAASARLRGVTVDAARAQLRAALERIVRAPLRAGDVMSSPVRCARIDWTMRQAGEEMARWGHAGLPVTDGETLVGHISRKDVDKAVRHGLAHAPVTGFMSRDVVTVSRDTDVASIEQLLATGAVQQAPVTEDGRIVGIVSRTDVLRAEHGDLYLVGRVRVAHPAATHRFLEGVKMLPEQVASTLALLGASAAETSTRAFVVGGFVRDMVLGVENLDIDVVVEGDGIAFATSIAEQTGAHLKVHQRFGTAVVAFDRRLHVDFAGARAEYYTRPGALPTVERSTLNQDLLRRDFTINAMAACLDPGCFGEITDPYDGLADLDAGVVRVLHPLSFVDDPTRVLRAARFEGRYGCEMDPATLGLARRAVEMGLLAEISGARMRDELLDVLAEQAPATVLARLRELGALARVMPSGARLEGVGDGLLAVEEALDTLPARYPGFRPQRRPALLAALATSASRASDAERWLSRLRLGRSDMHAARELARGGTVWLRRLQSPRGMRDSSVYRLLAPLSPEALTVTWARGDAVARERIERFFGLLARVRSEVSGADLIALGAAPGEAFSAILARALDDRLDGRAIGRAEELANLRRLAVSAGLIPSEKER